MEVRLAFDAKIKEINNKKLRAQIALDLDKLDKASSNKEIKELEDRIQKNLEILDGEYSEDSEIKEINNRIKNLREEIAEKHIRNEAEQNIEITRNQLKEALRQRSEKMEEVIKKITEMNEEIAKLKAEISKMEAAKESEEDLKEGKEKLDVLVGQRRDLVLKSAPKLDSDSELGNVKRPAAELDMPKAISSELTERVELLFTTDNEVNESYKELEQARINAIFLGRLDRTILPKLDLESERLDLSNASGSFSIFEWLTNFDTFKQAKKRFKKDKSYKKEYVDLLAMLVEERLTQGKDLKEITISAEMSDIAQEAVRKGIENFNAKSRRLIKTESEQKSDIYVRNAKDSDLYRFTNGQWEGRNQGVKNLLQGGKQNSAALSPEILSRFPDFSPEMFDQVKVIKEEENERGFTKTFVSIYKIFIWEKCIQNIMSSLSWINYKTGFERWFEQRHWFWKTISFLALILPAAIIVLVVPMIFVLVCSAIAAPFVLIGATVRFLSNYIYGTYSQEENFEKHILKELRSQGEDASAIIDLGCKCNVDEAKRIIQNIHQQILEEGNMPLNVVFKYKGLFYGATKGAVREYIEGWRGLENADASIDEISRLDKDIMVREDMISPQLESDYFRDEIFDDRRTEDQIKADSKIIKLGEDVLKKDSRLYFDGEVVLVDGTRKKLFTREITADKIIIKVDKTNIALLGQNKDKFLQGLRQLELEYRDLGKNMEIILPEVEQEQKEARNEIKDVVELFISQMPVLDNQNKRTFRLINDRAKNKAGNYEGGNNVLFSNEEIGNNQAAKNPNVFKGKKVLVARDLVFRDKAVFAEWLKNMLVTDEMRELDREQGKLIIGLDTMRELGEIELEKLKEVLDETFADEDIIVVNRAGKIIMSNVDLEVVHESGFVAAGIVTLKHNQPLQDEANLPVQRAAIVSSLPSEQEDANNQHINEHVSLSANGYERLPKEDSDAVSLEEVELVTINKPAEANDVSLQSGQIKYERLQNEDIYEQGNLTLTTVRLNENTRRAFERMDLSELKTVRINESFAKSPGEVMALTSLLERQGFRGDIEVQSGGKSIKLWREKLFTNGAIVKDVSSLEDLDKLLTELEKLGTDDSEYRKYSIVLNMKFREKIDSLVDWFGYYGRINKLIRKGVLGDLTITQRGQILATNNNQVDKLVKNYKIISRNDRIELKPLAAFEGIQESIDSPIDLKNLNFGGIGPAASVITSNFSLPIFDGNVVACIQGAQNAYKGYTTTLEKVTNPEEIDIKFMVRSFGRSLYNLGTEYGLLARSEAGGLPAQVKLESVRHLDSAA